MGRQSHHEQAGNDREEAYAIDKKAERNTDLRHQETRRCRANDARAVEHRAVERDGVHQVFAARDFNDERLPRRHVKSHGDTPKQTYDDDLPGPNHFRPDERRNGKRENHHRDLGADQDQALRKSIGRPAAPGREEEHRRGPGGGDNA